MSSFIDDLAGAFKGLFSHERKGEKHESLNQYEDDPVSQYVPPVEKNNVSEPPLEAYELHKNENIDNVISGTIRTEEPLNKSEFEINIPIESVLKEEEVNKKELLTQEDIDRILRLFISFSEIINEFDTYILQTKNEETKQIIGLCQYRLIESMVSNGATPIDKDVAFDCLRHVPVPFSIVKDGTPIKEILRIGLEYNGNVILKAIVSI